MPERCGEVEHEHIRRGGEPNARVVFILLLACFAYVHQTKFDGPTPASRLDLLHSIFVSGSVSIDRDAHNTTDKAIFNGHYYSDKAPGTVVAALPAFAFSALVLRSAGIPLDSKRGWLASSWMACAGSVALLAALGGAALYCWLCQLGLGRSSLVTVLALFLGAAPFPYSGMLFSHAMVIGLICICLWALRLGIGPAVESGAVREPPKADAAARADCEARGGTHRAAASLILHGQRSTADRGSRHRDLVAGFCGGWALASEFSSGLIVTALFLWLLITDNRRALRFALAGLPPLLLIPAYSLACFGSPVVLPYTLQASFPAMKEGIYAIKWPDPITAWNLLVPPTRGLLFWTPFLLISSAGYWDLAKASRPLFFLTYAVPLLHVTVISGRTWDWEAGPVLGPRLLAPMLPLLALPCALGVRRLPKVGAALALYSIAVTTLATLTDAAPPASFHNPLTELHIPLLLQGRFCPNLGTTLGLPHFLSILLFYSTLVGTVAYLWLRLPRHP